MYWKNIYADYAENFLFYRRPCFILFSRQNVETFDITQLTHAFLSLTVSKLPTLKNSQAFLAHPVYESSNSAYWIACVAK